jgi:hypothetical protein
MTKMKSAAGKVASSAKTAVMTVKTGGAAAVKTAAAGTASGRVQEAMKNGIK